MISNKTISMAFQQRSNDFFKGLKNAAINQISQSGWKKPGKFFFNCLKKYDQHFFKQIVRLMLPVGLFCIPKKWDERQKCSELFLLNCEKVIETGFPRLKKHRSHWCLMRDKMLFNKKKER